MQAERQLVRNGAHDVLAVCRSDTDAMMGFFTRLAKDNISPADLQFTSHRTFRAHVDKLCASKDSGWRKVKIPVDVPGFPHLKVPAVEVVYRDVVTMLRGFMRAFAKMEQFCWRWAAETDSNAAKETLIEHPCTGAWWREQAAAVAQLGGSLLALQARAGLHTRTHTFANASTRARAHAYTHTRTRTENEATQLTSMCVATACHPRSSTPTTRC
jgi:hypothetical protein